MSHTRARRIRASACAVVAWALLATACSPFVEVRPAGLTELARPAETSVVRARDGSVLAELHAEEDRRIVSLEEIPQAVRDAVVAVEDARFWEHDGLDARAVGRALVTNLLARDVVQGGSTITQQLAKNAVTGSRRTLQRKVLEASVALQLEASLSKAEILERYLNTVYFGNGAYGVATAAERYFGVDVADLGLAEAALLAGILRSPAGYDPFERPEAARGRRDVVLGLMLEQGLLSEEEHAAAVSSDLGVVGAAAPRGWRSPYFVDHVLDVLQHDPAFHVLGDTPRERAAALYAGGLDITTTLDPAWQASAERAVADVLTSPADPYAAVVALDPATGAVRALVGGRDYDDASDDVARFNLATDGARQPGSAFKPVVLAAALEAGIDLEDVYEAGSSITVEVPGAAPWEVSNYAGQDLGRLTVRQATAFSVNVVYAQLMDQVGPAAVAEMAERLGVARELEAVHALALGSEEVSPLELATVMATLAGGGVRRDPVAVERITDAEGVLLWERPDVPGERVLDPQVAWEVTLALEDVVTYGTGVRAHLQRPTAGKTGTSQDAADAWFAGFTGDLAAAVWVGFPRARVAMEPPRTRRPVEGGNWPAEIFARFGFAALADTPVAPFAIPDDHVVTVAVDVTRGCLPNAYTPPALIAERGYVRGDEPSEVCAEPTGPPTLDVPAVVGQTAEAARRLLSEAGFSVVEREEASSLYPPGYVVRQDPPPGRDQQLAGTGFVATVWVSIPPTGADVAVPDVLGLGLAQARELVEGAGLAVQVVVECPGGGDSCTGAAERPGVVWQQTPDAGEVLPAASPVVLYAYPAR